jgi:hypothetical protein
MVVFAPGPTGGVVVDKDPFSPLEESTPSLKKGFRSLPGKFFIPIRPPHGENPGQAIEVKVFDSRVSHRHLLWHLLFRGITALEWWILLQKLEISLKTGERLSKCVSLFGVLRLSGKTRKRLPSWSSRLRPIHKWMTSQDGQKGLSSLGGKNLLEYVTKELKVPQKGEPTEYLYTSRVLPYFLRRPRPPRFAGVGYKDKGTLGGSVIDLPSEEEWTPGDFDWGSQLLPLWKETLALFRP